MRLPSILGDALMTTARLHHTGHVRSHHHDLHANTPEHILGTHRLKEMETESAASAAAL
jgi:hypothetical protein